MKAPSSMIKINRLVCLSVALVISLVIVSTQVFGQTTYYWNGNGPWSPSDVPPASDGSTTNNIYIVQSGTCTINGGIMNSLTVSPGAFCTLSGTVTAVNVNVPFDSNWLNKNLTVNGTLNVNNLSIIGWVTGTGTINLSAGTYSMISGTNYGYCDVSNFNVLSGSIVIPTQVIFKSMTVAQGASVNLTYTGSPNVPTINNLTLNGSFVNNFQYSTSGGRTPTYYYLGLKNLIINSTGTYNSKDGFSRIDLSFKIGGGLTAAGSVNSYYYNWDVTDNTSELDVFGNANIKMSDLTYNDPTYQNLGTLKVYGGGKFKIDKNLTVSTININSGGSITASGSPTITASTIADPIDGRLVLQTATLDYNATTLTLNGTNSALGYINKPGMRVTVTGSTDSIYNCNLQRATINSGAKGYISNSAAGYKIQRVDVSDSLTIASMPKCDTINVASNGKVRIKGDTRVNRLLDISTGGHVTSKGNLTMRDSSNLFFTQDGQIDTIKWHRKYGSTGWIYVGTPFSGLTRVDIAQQTISMNKYIESGTSKTRWYAVPSNETLGVGSGYIIGLGSISNDTLVFKGQPRLRDVSVSELTYTTSNGTWFDYQRGYNLVSNPFTAPISIDTFFNDNPNIDAIYYWDNRGQSNGSFITRTKGGTFVPDVDKVSDKNKTKISQKYLAPNQAFFVKIPSSGSTTSVNFKTTSITRDLNNNFLKAASNSILRLNVKNNSGSKNDIVFQFNKNAKKSYTPWFDYFKLLSGNSPLEFYSLKDSDKFVIQTLKVDTSELHIPLGVSVTKNEKHLFWIDNFDALPVGVSLYIKDKVVNREVNLNDSAFTVTLSKGTFDNRFELIMKNSTITTDIIQINNSDIENSNIENDLKMWALSGQVYLDFIKERKNTQVQLIDLNGRVLYKKEFSSIHGVLKLETNLTLNQIYLVKINGGEKEKTYKLFLK